MIKTILGCRSSCPTQDRLRGWADARRSSGRAPANQRTVRLAQRPETEAGLRRVSEMGTVGPGRGSVATEEGSVLPIVNTECFSLAQPEILLCRHLGFCPQQPKSSPLPFTGLLFHLGTDLKHGTDLKPLWALASLFKDKWKCIYCFFCPL